MNIIRSSLSALSLQDFDKIGSVNDVPALEMDMESLEEKPWRKVHNNIKPFNAINFQLLPI